ncbi:non-specific lipid transfer protein GPI-anchored 15 [Prosopis cineraria]|uniref:non-specific lipid transfer protein GPI-anchored 15 n=1 Tax=Prosopis cineraria TaxID=364024 RepID=UPI00240E9D4D|nr:non-specific lipid transfer protein GPI-anchored 15 [Prosopis cineraria]
MALNVRTLTVTVLMLMLASEMLLLEAEAAGECGRTPIGSAAASLTPCLAATRDVRARVSPACCARVSAMIRMSPKCLCAVLLSPMARQAKINPAIAVTVPKRCNIRNRPAGKKCGRYTVP